MKVYFKKVLIFIMFVSLGFFISYEIKNIKIQKKNLDSNLDSENMNVEIKTLLKNKEENQKLIDELLAKIELYEENAAKQNEEAMSLKNELDSQKLALGKVDAIGNGIIITLSQKQLEPEIQKLATISGEELSYLINELNYAGAEAISINDLRITTQTGIKSSDNNSFIDINGEKVSPRNKITIKAIGDSTKLSSAITFPNVLDFGSLVYYDVKWDEAKDIKIFKYNRTYNQDFIKVLDE